MTDQDLFYELSRTEDLEARVAEAMTELTRRRKAVRDAEAKLTEVRSEQERMSSRVSKLHEAIADKSSLSALAKNPDTYQSAAKKRAELEGQRAVLAQALDHHVLFSIMPAQVGLKRAALDLLIAERAYILSASLAHLRKYADLFQALHELDPACMVSYGEASFVTQTLLALDARDAEIADSRLKVAEEELYLSRQQRSSEPIPQEATA